MSVSFIKQRDLTRLERLVANQEPALQRRFLERIREMRRANTLAQLEDAIASGNVQQIFNDMTAQFSLFGDDVNDVFVLSGERTATYLNGEIAAQLRFDRINERAVRIQQNNRLELVREFTQQQMRATNEALTQGIRVGANPVEQARRFRDSIGLTQRQVRAINNYRAALESNDPSALRRQLRDKRFDSSLRRALGSGEPLTRDRIDRMVSRYEERWLKFRSENIARTEALRAVHQGNNEMFAQAVESGSLEPGQIEQTWLTAQDAAVRDSHDTMEGQIRSFGEAFVTGAGNLLMYPGDPDAPADETIRCRCTLATRLLNASSQ